MEFLFFRYNHVENLFDIVHVPSHLYSCMSCFSISSCCSPFIFISFRFFAFFFETIFIFDTHLFHKHHILSGWLFVRGKVKPRIIESMSKCWKWRRYNNYWQKTGVGAWKFFRQRLAHSSVTSPDYILCECVYLTLIFFGQKTPEYK